MTKQEFENMTKHVISDDDFNFIVQMVYTFHPAISDAHGKEEITALYKIGGMRLMKDMLPTAEKAAEIENHIAETKLALWRLQEELAELGK